MATPADTGGTGAQEGIIFAGKLPGSARHLDRNGITPVRFPPPTRRLLLSPPPVSTLTTAKPVAIPGVSPLPRVNGIPPLPPGAKIYCSPWSVLYNTGSICFNPDIETINPDFYPWGLFSAPAFVNVPGYVPPFPLGMLVQPCPQCATADSGLRPPLTPIDRWHRATSGSIAGLGGYPRLAAPAEAVRRAKVAPPATVKLEGPPVVLVLKNGTRELVSRYWLGQDWLLHFITVSGSRRAIPLGQMNLKETGSVNYGRGVTFVMPAWPEPRSSR